MIIHVHCVVSGLLGLPVRRTLRPAALTAMLTHDAYALHQLALFFLGIKAQTVKITDE